MSISKIVILCFVCLMVQSKLNIYMPYQGVKQFKQLRTAQGYQRKENQSETQILYNLANFGHIPYGQPMPGMITVPNGNPEFCDEDPTQKKRPQNSAFKNFMLVKRGGCKFTKKIILAQKLNIHMVIIYDNDTASTTPNIVMANDGHGHLVEVPSIFISYKDGENILKTYQKCDKQLILLIEFDIGIAEKAYTTLFLDPGHREGFIMLRDFYANYLPFMKQYLDLSVAFNVKQNCFYCASQDCIDEAKGYCYYKDPKHTINVTGKQVLQQFFRSYLIKETDKSVGKEKWWQYMINMDQNVCFGKADGLRDCSKEVMNQLGINSGAIAQAVKTQMSGTNNYQIFNSFVQMSKDAGILYYPEAAINNRTYYGIFKAPEIFDMLCHSLYQPPHECVNIGGKQRAGQGENYFLVIVLIIMGMSGAFILILIVYTKLIKRQVNVQLSSEVNKMVENYVVLTEQKSNNLVNKSGQAI